MIALVGYEPGRQPVGIRAVNSGTLAAGITNRTGKGSDMSTRTTSKSSDRPGMIGRLQALIRDTYTEIKKVTWPDQETTRNLTVLVIVMATILGILLGLVDYGFRELWDWIPA